MRLAWSLLLALVLVAGMARAEEDAPEKAQARLLLSQGNALFEKGDLRAALVDFRAAYTLYPSPKLLVNAAAAERELGDLPGAANDLRHFLDEAPDDDPFLVDKARQDLRSLERRVGKIVMQTWPARSTVEVDGKPGREITYARPGEHHVRARTPSGGELERDLSVSAGESVDVGPPPSEPLAARRVQAAGTVEHEHKSRWWISLVVVGAAAVAVGAGVGIYFALQPAPQPLKGDLGIYKFSMFQ